MASLLAQLLHTSQAQDFTSGIESRVERISEGVKKKLIAPHQELVANIILSQAKAVAESDEEALIQEIQLKQFSMELDRLYYLSRVDALVSRICDLAEEAKADQVDTQQIRLRTLEEANNAKESLSKLEASAVSLKVAGEAGIKWLQCFGNQLHRLRAEAQIQRMYKGTEGDEAAQRLLQLALSKLSADRAEAMMTLGDIEKVLHLAQDQLEALSKAS